MQGFYFCNSKHRYAPVCGYRLSGAIIGHTNTDNL